VSDGKQFEAVYRDWFDCMRQPDEAVKAQEKGALGSGDYR
jgi:hypothetical protein